MRLRDLKIGTRLGLSLGSILLLTGLLALLSWEQNVLLETQTRQLYSHPFTVRRALYDLHVDMESLHQDLMTLLQDADGRASNTILHVMDEREEDADRQLLVLQERYLGPAEDILRLKQDLQRWRAIREDTLQLVREGKRSEAQSRTTATGAEGKLQAALGAHVKVVSDFARQKADQINLETEQLFNTLNYQLFTAVALILIFSVVVAGLLLRGIRAPLTDLTAATGQFRQGHLDARAQYTSKNEFGTLAASFNAMADAIRKEIQAKERLALFTNSLVREDDAHGFCRVLLKALLLHTGSQMGGVYLLDEARAAFVHFESIGMDDGGRVAFSATGLDGEFGSSLASRRIQRIRDIPADTRFTFVAMSGKLIPREILTIPVVESERVSAIVSLASIHAYSDDTIQLMDDVWGVLSARMNGVLAFQRIRDLAGRLEAQNRELDEQKRELAAQASELVAQNAELERQKEQIGEANRQKSQFVSNMSHELRTPLNSVIALSGVLNRRLVGKIPVEELGYLEVIERNGKNLLELINDILDLSRIEAGREEAHIQKFSMRDLVADLVLVVAPLAKEKGLALKSDVSQVLPAVASDPDKCRHILQNLLSNAIKFTSQGQVSIDATASTDTMEIHVSDSGIGIAKDKHDLIFQEFRQADESTSRKYGGSGLGLSIARKYARMVGGDLTVRSALGQGATFTLRLPMSATVSSALQSSGPTARPNGIARQTAAGQGRTILVVEDSDPAIVQLTDILKVAGFGVEVARDGRAALDRVAQSLPDAVVLDLMMPGVDGFQVLRELRNTPRTATLPVLILTARQVSREELSFLSGNHIHQLIQKGDVDRAGLLAAVTDMVAPVKPIQAILPSRRRCHRSGIGKPVVMVVEDNTDNMRTMKALLEPCYHVIEAQDGQAIVERARQHRPGIILMDVALPRVDGIAALAELRRHEDTRDIPVLAITASAMTGDREAFLAHGFDGYISKPIQHDLLMKALEETIVD